MTERNYNEKFRAVFLAAIMVTSVFAGTLALTGSAAALNQNPSSGDVAYSQDIAFQGENVVAEFESGDATSGETATLRRVETFGAPSDDGIIQSTIADQYTVVDSPDPENVKIDTDDLQAGDYILVDDDGDVVTQRRNTFEITEQSLSSSFADADQPALTGSFGDSKVELDVSSTRNDFDLNASAGGDLDDQELFNILAGPQLDSLDGVSINDQGKVTFDGSGSDVSGSASNQYDSPYVALDEQFTTVGTNPYSRITGVTDYSVADASPSSNNFNRFTHDGDTVQETSGTGADTVTLNGIEVGFYQSDQDSDTADFDEKVLIRSGGIDEQDVSFVNIDEGDYSFDFSAADTEATTSADVTATERDADATFDQGTQQVAAGDIVEFNLTLSDNDETYVQIGSEDTDFVEVLYLKADDASQAMEVRFNTRLLGTTAQVSQGDVYDTTNVDTIESAIYQASDTSANGGQSDINAAGSLGPRDLYEDDGAFSSPVSSATSGSNAGTYFEAYLDAMGIIDASSSGDQSVADQLDRPLQPTEYQIQVAGYSGEDKIFDADPGGEANNQLNSQSLELTQPEIGDITVHTAPEEDADDTSNVQELVDAATVRDEIALDDRLVVQVEATGIYGALVADAPNTGTTTYPAGPQNVDFDILDDGASTDRLADLVGSRENVDFEVVADASTGNQAALEVALGTSAQSDTDSYLVFDEDNGQFFLVVDTSSDSAFANGDAPDEGTDFEAFMEYDADDADNRFEFRNSDSTGASAPFSLRSGTGGGYQNYPYLQQGEVVSSTAELTLEPRSISYDNVNEDDQVQVTNAEDAEVSATTNVAPGTDAEIRLSSTDASSSFQVGNDVNITEDGSISTTYDVSNQEIGDLFDTNFRVEGSSTDSTEGVIVEAVEEAPETNETDEPADDGEEEPADDGEEEPADDGEEEPADDGESTDDGTPGFGAVVALVALIGAALLAVRRQN